MKITFNFISIKDHKAQIKHDVRARVPACVDKEVLDLLVCWSLTSWPPFWWEAQRSRLSQGRSGRLFKDGQTGGRQSVSSGLWNIISCAGSFTSSFGGLPRTDDRDNNAVWLQSVEAFRWSPGMLNLGSTVIQSLASHINNLVSDAIDQFWNSPSTLADH